MKVQSKSGIIGLPKREQDMFEKLLARDPFLTEDRNCMRPRSLPRPSRRPTTSSPALLTTLKLSRSRLSVSTG